MTKTSIRPHFWAHCASCLCSLISIILLGASTTAPCPPSCCPTPCQCQWSNRRIQVRPYWSGLLVRRTIGPGPASQLYECSKQLHNAMWLRKYWLPILQSNDEHSNVLLNIYNGFRTWLQSNCHTILNRKSWPILINETKTYTNIPI